MPDTFLFPSRVVEWCIELSVHCDLFVEWHHPTLSSLSSGLKQYRLPGLHPNDFCSNYTWLMLLSLIQAPTQDEETVFL